jgi:hypothetical protein
MTIRKRRCPHCGKLFEPAKEYYRLCHFCFQDTAAIGSTHSKRRPGGADLMHGGQSRLRDGTIRRPLALRGDQSRQRILEGFRDFATDYYHRQSGLSTIFERAGCDNILLNELKNQPQTLNNMLIDLCPAFREWVFQFTGDKAMEFVIEYYGLYGDDRLSPAELAYNLDLKNAESFKVWTLRELRKMDAANALEERAAAMADKHF